MTIFFLISGFLLFRPFIAARNGGAAAPATSDYVRRRALRIYPAYWLVLTVLVLVPGLIGVWEGHWLAQYSLGHALFVPDDGGCTAAIFECGLGQTWSLGVEVSFYIALPVYVLASGWLAARLGRRWLWGELAVLLALALVSIALLSAYEPAPAWLGGSALGWMLWFGLGMGMAALSVALEGRPRMPAGVRLIAAHPGVCWLSAIGGYVVLSLLASPGTFLITGGERIAIHVGFGAIALLLMLPAVFGDGAGGLPRRLLAHPLVAWLGLISYGIFLWHYVVALELGTRGADLGFGLALLGTLAITIACASISYYAVERPLLRFKYRSRRESGAPRGGIA